MKVLLSWTFLALTIAAGPVGLVVFLRAAFRGLDWPWWMAVVLVLAFCSWSCLVAWLMNRHLRITTEEAVRRANLPSE